MRNPQIHFPLFFRHVSAGFPHRLHIGSGLKSRRHDLLLGPRDAECLRVCLPRFHGLPDLLQDRFRSRRIEAVVWRDFPRQVKTRMADCRDEDEARKLLVEMREAEEVVLIKEIRAKRLTADLQAAITDTEVASVKEQPLSQPAFERARAHAKQRFAQCIAEFVAAVCPDLTGQLVALDGKTLRGSRKADESTVQIVSTWACHNGLTLAQRAVESKRNEITAVPKLLRHINLKGPGG